MINSNNRQHINKDYAISKFNKKVNTFKSVNRVYVKRGGIKL